MKLIDKDALVAEIDKLYNEEIDTYTRNILDRLKSNINTLEVKEIGVDVGSSEGDWDSKTVQFIDANGNIKEITFNKAQKGEKL